MRDMVRYFAWGLLLGPLALVVLWFVLTFLPGVADFLCDLVWGLLGEVRVFSQAAELLQLAISNRDASLQTYLTSFLVLLLEGLSDALIIGCCVFFVKATCTFFNRRWEGRFTRPEWLLTLIGVLVGVIFCRLKGVLGAAWSGIVTLVVCLVCYLGGLGLMVRGLNFTRGGTYHNRWAGFLINLLEGIVGNMLDALCGVVVITVLFSGRDLIKGRGGILPCLLWIVVSTVLICVRKTINDAMRPRDT